MVVGVKEVVGGEKKRAGSQGGASLVRKTEQRKKQLVSIALLKLHWPALQPILSLQFYWLAKGIKQRDKELPTPSLGFKAIQGSFPSIMARGHLAFAKGARDEVRLLSFDFNSTVTWCIFNRYLRIIVITTIAAILTQLLLCIKHCAKSMHQTFHLILMITLQGRCYYYPHFTDAQNEDRGCKTQPQVIEQETWVQVQAVGFWRLGFHEGQ